MTLQQLRYFHAACRCHSLTEAAKALHVSQPSVSMAIRALEHEFGLKLTARTYQGFALTSAGERLFALAGDLLRHAEQLTVQMQGMAKARHLLRLGMPPMAGLTLLPQLYTRFCPRHAGLTITTQEGGANTLLRGLRDRTLDIAFVTHGAPLGGEFQTLPVMQTEIVWCVRQGHPCAAMQAAPVEALRGEPLVLFQKSFSVHEQVMHRFAQAGITPQVVHATDQLSTVQQLIHGGVATGFLLRSSLAQLPGLVGIPLSPPMPMQISLVWEKSRPLSAEMRTLIDDYQCLTET